MQAGFLDQQRRAQQAHFRRAYPNAEWLIVEQAGRPIGRLYIEANDEVVHGVDIALLPECRGSGLGAAVMQDLIGYGRDLGRKISVFVEHGQSGGAPLRTAGLRARRRRAGRLHALCLAAAGHGGRGLDEDRFVAGAALLLAERDDEDVVPLAAAVERDRWPAAAAAGAAR